MAVAGHIMQQFEAHGATGSRKSLVVLLDECLGIEPVIVRIEPKLRHLAGGAAGGIGVVWCGDRAIWVPAAPEIDDAHHLGWLQAGIMHGEKAAGQRAAE